MTYRVRDIDKHSEFELEIVTRMCMTTVLETIPEFERSEDKARAYVPNFSFDQMREMFLVAYQKPTHRFLVAVDEGDRIVGHMMIFRKTSEVGDPFGYFFSCYAEPAHRRRGMTSQLMDEALAWFDQEDWQYLQAHTHVTNEALRRLFERYHFQVAERLETPWPHLRLQLDRY